MRKLRKLADRTGWTGEDLIHEGILEFVAKHEAEKELETKIIRFPTPMRVAYKAKANKYTPTKCDLGRRRCCRKVFCLTVSRFLSFMAAA